MSGSSSESGWSLKLGRCAAIETYGNDGLAASAFVATVSPASELDRLE